MLKYMFIYNTGYIIYPDHYSQYCSMFLLIIQVLIYRCHVAIYVPLHCGQCNILCSRANDIALYLVSAATFWSEWTVQKCWSREWSHENKLRRPTSARNTQTNSYWNSEVIRFAQLSPSLCMQIESRPDGCLTGAVAVALLWVGHSQVAGNEQLFDVL